MFLETFCGLFTPVNSGQSFYVSVRWTFWYFKTSSYTKYSYGSPRRKWDFWLVLRSHGLSCRTLKGVINQTEQIKLSTTWTAPLANRNQQFKCHKLLAGSNSLEKSQDRWLGGEAQQKDVSHSVAGGCVQVGSPSPPRWSETRGVGISHGILPAIPRSALTFRDPVTLQDLFRNNGMKVS